MSNAHGDDASKEVQVSFSLVVIDELLLCPSNMQRFFVLQKRKGQMIGEELSGWFRVDGGLSNDLQTTIGDHVNNGEVNERETEKETCVNAEGEGRSSIPVDGKRFCM